jgi:predicted N-acyltransferase
MLDFLSPFDDWKFLDGVAHEPADQGMRMADAPRIVRTETIAPSDPERRAAWRAIEPPGTPFTDFEFLAALEASGSLGPASGWLPRYLLAYAGSRLVGALPAFEKTNSYGEYIFDWEWARAYQRNGLPYYPKLTLAVPFTPATGSKILVAPDADRAAVERALLDELETLAHELEVSSTHALFLPEAETAAFAARGYLVRHSSQFHWTNAGYRDFAAFLAALSGKRRRQIERERRQVRELGLDLRIVTGAALEPRHAAAMTAFYRDTTGRKRAIPYLRDGFFAEVIRTMADRVVLATAEQGGEIVAAALNFQKGDRLFGRYWGCRDDFKNLHFELCYYQTIEHAIGAGLAGFEAGAQGEHKVARGFLPTLTYSAHKLVDPRFHAAVADYVEAEKAMLQEAHAEYLAHSPFKVPSS